MLTIAIPTLGRPTLARTVYSFLEQLEPGDEVILVADPSGDPNYVRFIHSSILSKRLGVHSSVISCGHPGGWGQPQRNAAYRAASQPYVWCLADDDVATPAAVPQIRKIAAAMTEAGGDQWAIFRVGRATDTPWVWHTQEVRVGNLDADCIVAPSTVAARWGLGYDGDAVFARALLAELGPPVFRPELVAVTNPSAEYLERHYRTLAFAGVAP